MTLRLDRLQAANFNPRGMQTLWQRHCETLEAANASLQNQITTNATLLASVIAAQAAATAAQSSANTVIKTDKISASSTSPSNILTATDAGADATITIANHTRIYGDGTTLAITGASLTARAYSTTYWIYYDDSTTAVAAPTFQSTTSAPQSQFNYASGRHFVGKITTPASGAGGTGGGGSPPGGGGPYP